jgi:hypothetical protein
MRATGGDVDIYGMVGQGYVLLIPMLPFGVTGDVGIV